MQRTLRWTHSREGEDINQGRDCAGNVALDSLKRGDSFSIATRPSKLVDKRWCFGWLMMFVR